MPNRSAVLVIALLPVLGTTAGCACLGRPPGPPVPCAGDKAIFLAVDGAGDSRGLSNALRTLVDEEELPYCVESLGWSHGYQRILADQCDQGHIRAEGRRLAEVIVGHRQQDPDRPIYLFGHSAGALVVLAAGEHLPAGGVDRVFLLAPTACVDADLRPILRASRDGLDVYHSGHDFCSIFAGFTLFPVTGRLCNPIASRVGFRRRHGTPADDALYAGMRQHAWHPALKEQGHDGGHYGAYHKKFLQAQLRPILQGWPDRAGVAAAIPVE